MASDKKNISTECRKTDENGAQIYITEADKLNTTILFYGDSFVEGAADFEYVASMSTLLEKHGRIDELDLIDFVPVQSALTQGQIPIPEPTTLFLLAAGMGLLVRRARRR